MKRFVLTKIFFPRCFSLISFVLYFYHTTKTFQTYLQQKHMNAIICERYFFSRITDILCVYPLVKCFLILFQTFFSQIKIVVTDIPFRREKTDLFQITLLNLSYFTRCLLPAHICCQISGKWGGEKI